MPGQTGRVSSRCYPPDMRYALPLLLGLALGGSAVGAPEERSVEQLLEQLGVAHRDARVDALRELGARGAEASAAEVALVHALSDDALVIRKAAVDALGRIGVSSQRVRERLVRRAEREPALCGVAALALARLGAGDELLHLAREPELRKLMDDPLRGAGSDGITGFVFLCDAEEPAVRAFGVAGLRSAPPVERARIQPVLVRRIDDAVISVRTAAILALGRHSSVAPLENDPLLCRMRSGSRMERLAVLAAVHADDVAVGETELATTRRRTIEQLGLDDFKEEVRLEAIRWTAAANDPTPGLLSALGARLFHDTGDIPEEAACALARLTTDRTGSVPDELEGVIRSVLPRLSGEARVHAGITLVNLGTSDDVAARAVASSLDELDWGVRRDWPMRFDGRRNLRGGYVIGIGGRESGAPWASWVRRTRHAEVLESLRTLGPSAVAATLELLDAESPRTRAHAAWVSALLTAPDAPDRLRLRPLLSDDDIRVRTVTAAALRETPALRREAAQCIARAAAERRPSSPGHVEDPVVRDRSDRWQPDVAGVLRDAGDLGELAVAELLPELEGLSYTWALQWLNAFTPLAPNTRAALEPLAGRDEVRELLDRD